MTDWTEEAWAVYTNTLSLQLEKDDIASALQLFKQRTGSPAKSLRLNPKNERFASEIPAGIEIGYFKHVMLWEIWLGAVPAVEMTDRKEVKPKQLTLDDTLEKQGEAVQPNL